jgi:hypothetical protein
LVFSIVPLSEARFLNDLNSKEKQQIEAKVDSCYPVGLEKGHPTFVLRPLHRTSSAVQILRQTQNYYRPTDNTELTVICWKPPRGATVGISRLKQIFLIFRSFRSVDWGQMRNSR